MMINTKLIALAVLTSAALSAQAAEGNAAAAAKDKTSMCMGCHGIAGYRATFPEVYHVPKLGGQHPAYIVKALNAYKSASAAIPPCAASPRVSRIRTSLTLPPITARRNKEPAT